LVTRLLLGLVQLSELFDVFVVGAEVLEQIFVVGRERVQRVAVEPPITNLRTLVDGDGVDDQRVPFPARRLVTVEEWRAAGPAIANC
jgi:hypothetical protein